ncbi:MAG: HAD family hydrolase [Chloroflexi bacterium]|nr:HAD family hydrolase [Chloroflexota bacterium]
MGRTIDTIIFDLDGTLVDSQPAALGAAIEALSRFRVQVTADDLRKQFGGGARKLLSYFLVRDLGLEQSGRVIDDAIRLRNDLQLEFTDKVALLPQVKQLLGSLKDSGYRLALATMSSRNIVDQISSYHGIDRYFDAVMTADDVINVKPDPEILTKTLGLLGAQVDRTLYVGDSGHDLEAAVSLGMPFLLADTGIYVRGDTRRMLRVTAEENGYPIVGLEGLLDILKLVRRDSS